MNRVLGDKRMTSRIFLKGLTNKMITELWVLNNDTALLGREVSVRRENSIPVSDVIISP